MVRPVSVLWLAYTEIVKKVLLITRMTPWLKFVSRVISKVECIQKNYLTKGLNSLNQYFSPLW